MLFKQNIDGSDNCNNKDLKHRFLYLDINTAKTICYELDDEDEEDKKNKQTNKMNADLPNTRNASVQRNALMGFGMRKLRGLDILIY
jgi:hypothetical protein